MTKIKFEDYELRQLRASLVALTESYKREGLVDQSLKIISVEQVEESSQWYIIEIIYEKDGELFSDGFAPKELLGRKIKGAANYIIMSFRLRALRDELEKLKERIDAFNEDELKYGGAGWCIKCEITEEEVYPEDFAESPQKTVLNIINDNLTPTAK